jgi:hypothetical protein
VGVRGGGEEGGGFVLGVGTEGGRLRVRGAGRGGLDGGVGGGEGHCAGGGI